MAQPILKQLEELVIVLGPWSQQVVLGGGVALIVYDEIMAPNAAGAVGTYDVDFLIPKKPIVEAPIEQVSKLLKQSGFEYRLKSQTTTPAIESYVKETDGYEIEVEFITDAKLRNRVPSVEIKEAGLVAQSLSYIEMSLEAATEAKLSEAAVVKIVRPEAWLYHKGLTFPKRGPDSVKRLKDLYGIWFLATQLTTFSEATLVNLMKLQMKQPNSWKETFEGNLADFCKTATPATWTALEQQDPAGRLRKEAFIDLIETLSQQS